MDIRIDNESFSKAFGCLNEANVMLESGLGNFSSLDASAMKLVGLNDLGNKSRLDFMNEECDLLYANMKNTITKLMAMDETSVYYFRDHFDTVTLNEILGTAGMVGTKFFEGFLTAGEQIVDGFASIGGFLVGIVDKDAKEKVGQWVSKDHIGDMFKKAYAEGGFLNSIEQNSLFSSQSTGANIIKGFGTAAGYIGVMAVTGGTMTAVKGGSFATGMISGLNSITVDVVTSAVGGFGGGTEDALQSGMSYNDALKQGAKEGAVQGAFAGGVGLGVKSLGKALGSADDVVNVADDALGKATSSLDNVSLSVVDDTVSDTGKIVKVMDNADIDVSDPKVIYEKVMNGDMSKDDLLNAVASGKISKDDALHIANDKCAGIDEKQFSNRKEFRNEKTPWHPDEFNRDLAKIPDVVDSKALTVIDNNTSLTTGLDGVPKNIVKVDDMVGGTPGAIVKVDNIIDDVSEVTVKANKFGAVPISALAVNTAFESWDNIKESNVNNLVPDNVLGEIAPGVVLPDTSLPTDVEPVINPQEEPGTNPNGEPGTTPGVSPSTNPGGPSSSPGGSPGTTLGDDNSTGTETGENSESNQTSNNTATSNGSGYGNISNSIVNSPGAILDSYNGAVINSNNITDSYNTTNNYYTYGSCDVPNNENVTSTTTVTENNSSDTLKAIVGLGVAGLAGVSTAAGYTATKDKKNKKDDNEDDDGYGI